MKHKIMPTKNYSKDSNLGHRYIKWSIVGNALEVNYKTVLYSMFLKQFTLKA